MQASVKQLLSWNGKGNNSAMIMYSQLQNDLHMRGKYFKNTALGKHSTIYFSLHFLENLFKHNCQFFYIFCQV